MESYGRRGLEKAKQRLLEKHFLARDIGQFFALAIHGSDNFQVMEIWDFFPELFQEEKAEAEVKRTEQALAAYKAQMIDFAFRHNSRMGGGKHGRDDA